MICAAGRLIVKMDNGIASNQFSGNMHPHIAFGSGFSAVVNYLECGFIDIMVSNGFQQHFHMVIDRAKQFKRKPIDIPGNGLTCNRDAFALKFSLQAINRNAQHNFIVHDVSPKRWRKQ